MTPAAGGLWGTHQFGVDRTATLHAEVWAPVAEVSSPEDADPALLIANGSCDWTK